VHLLAVIEHAKPSLTYPQSGLLLTSFGCTHFYLTFYIWSLSPLNILIQPLSYFGHVCPTFWPIEHGWSNSSIIKGLIGTSGILVSQERDVSQPANKDSVTWPIRFPAWCLSGLLGATGKLVSGLFNISQPISKTFSMVDPLWWENNQKTGIQLHTKSPLYCWTERVKCSQP